MKGPHHLLHVPQDAPDFVMVITLEDEVLTLRIRDILDVQDAPWTGHAVVQHHTHINGAPVLCTVVIQEAPVPFWERCLQLMDAIKQQNRERINVHFPPPWQSITHTATQKE